MPRMTEEELNQALRAEDGGFRRVDAPVYGVYGVTPGRPTYRQRILYWLPAILLVILGSIVGSKGLTMWTRHNAQHTSIERSLTEIAALLNQQIQKGILKP